MKSVVFSSVKPKQKRNNAYVSRPLLILLLLLTSISLWARPLTVGSLSETPGGEIALFQPFSQYLAAGLIDFGIDDAQVIVRRENAEMAKLLRQAN